LGLDVHFWGLKGSALLKELKTQQIPVIDDAISWRADPLALPRIAKKVKNLGVTHIHLHWSGGVWAFWGSSYFVMLK